MLNVMDEFGLYMPETYEEAPASKRNWLRSHKIGNKLPRGKQFKKYRHLEKRPSPQNIGKIFMSGIQESLK